jgi:hypothetical protein
MKKGIFASIFLLLCLTATAQSVQVNDLAASVGSWEGKLTYLDYSSGEPYTMPANIKVRLTEDKSGYVMAYEYPNEPQASSIDTTFIRDNFFGKDKIVAFEKASGAGYTLVTEVDGTDGNDNKNAVLRHVYRVTATNFSITKEVKFEGTELWIKRNEYLLDRAAN